MTSNDAPVMTPQAANDRQERLRPRGGEEEPVVLDKVRARQGVTGHNVRYVLGFGLAAVIIAFAIILFFNFFP
jgi:hypothetical protein